MGWPLMLRHSERLLGGFVCGGRLRLLWRGWRGWAGDFVVLDRLQRTCAHLGARLQIDHERPAGLHRSETGVYAIGQAALLADFGHEPCTETTTAEDLVTQGQRRIVWIITVKAQLREHQIG